MKPPSAGLLRTLVLLLWSLFFVWLMIGGEVYRYIGPRTRWVVLFGAATLFVAAAMQGSVLRRGSTPPGTNRKELAALAYFLIPIALVVLIPRPSLGSQAALRKSSGTLVSSASRFAPVPQMSGEISFPEISYASESSEYAATMGISDGLAVKLTGFVTHPTEGADGTFALTRFETFCCAADAIPYSVTVEPEDQTDYPDDTWLTVSGVLVRMGDQFVLDAGRVKEVSEPQNPYI
jgi:uncharacterized repeat protein (TIGR03943 family)